MLHDRRTAFVIDDDPGMRNSLCMTLEAASIHAEAFGSAEEFLAEYPDGASGCLVLDLRLSGMSGLELLQQLRSRKSEMPVIMITGHGDVPTAVQSMKLGALDFLEKSVDPHELVAKVVAALGQVQGRQTKEDQIADARRRLAALTPREQELLKLLATGRSSKQIAVELQISRRTVENHRAHLLAKTRAQNIAKLVQVAMLAGLV